MSARCRPDKDDPAHKPVKDAPFYKRGGNVTGKDVQNIKWDDIPDTVAKSVRAQVRAYITKQFKRREAVFGKGSQDSRMRKWKRKLMPETKLSLTILVAEALLPDLPIRAKAREWLGKRGYDVQGEPPSPQEISDEDDCSLTEDES